MTRSNPCAGNPCADICVLTKTGHKCVCPEGLTSVRGQCEGNVPHFSAFVIIDSFVIFLIAQTLALKL